MFKLLKRFIYDPTLTTYSKIIFASGFTACLPGLYIIGNTENFGFMSNYAIINTVFKYISFGIFFIIPTILFITALIPSRFIRLLVSALNILQVRPQGLFTALNNYIDIIKTTKYYSLQYKYQTDDRLSYLHILNKKASEENVVPIISEDILVKLAKTQSTITELALNFQEEFTKYKTALVTQLELEQYQAIKSEGLSVLQSIGTTLLE